MTLQGIKDNAQHIAGMVIGFVNRFTGTRYPKEQRGKRWFCTGAANLVAHRYEVKFLPYK